jgi:hypothetical protein
MSAKKTPKKTNAGKEAVKTQDAITSRTPEQQSADLSDSPETSQPEMGGERKSEVNRPDRKDVIQLATQLVSAQIAAYSHHETATSLFNEFRQMTLDVADTLRRNPVPLPDSNSVVSAAIDSMSRERLARFRSRKQPALQPMSHPDLDRLFQSAMRRAFVMLNAPFDPERVVFAEQIFSHTEVLAEGAIRKRFIDFKWPNVKSGIPVNTLMKDVNRWFTKHLKDLDVTRRSVRDKETIFAFDPTIPIKTRIEAETERLSWLLSQISSSETLTQEVRSAYRALESALSQFTSTRNGFDIGGVFRSLDATNASNYIFLMFTGMGPKDKEHSSGTKEGKKAKEEGGGSGRIKYRPWAIFRYLRLFGNKEGDELGMSLNRRLRAQNLNPAEIPDVAGIEPAEFGFGPLHEEVDDFLYDEEALGQSDIADDFDDGTIPF